MAAPITRSMVERPEDISRRVFNQFTHDAGKQSLLKYVRHAYGSHFKKNAYTAPGGEYGYQEPSDAYERRKIRRFGDAIPGVYRGITQRKAGQTTVTATATRARYILKPGHALVPWLRRGLETVAALDIQRIVLSYQISVYTSIEKFRGKRIRRRTS